MLRQHGTLCRDKLVWLAGGAGFPGCSVAEADGSPQRTLCWIWPLWLEHWQRGPLKAAIKWPRPPASQRLTLMPRASVPSSLAYGRWVSTGMKLHQGHFLITVDTLTKTVSLIDAKVKGCGPAACVCVHVCVWVSLCVCMSDVEGESSGWWGAYNVRQMPVRTDP